MRTLCVALVMLASVSVAVDVSANHVGRHIPRPPRGCQIVRSWEDMSAIAKCGHGIWFVFDPDGDGRDKPRGWYRWQHWNQR